MTLLRAVEKGIREFIVEPFFSREVFYNPVNSAVYALLFAIIAFYGVRLLLRRLDVKVDRAFVMAVVPYGLFASALRVSRDVVFTGTETSWYYLLDSPVIFFTVFVATIVSLGVGTMVASRTSRTKMEIWGGIGWVLFLLTLVQLPFSDYGRLGLILLYGVPFFGIVWILGRKFKVTDRVLAASSAQLFDGLMTFVAIVYFQAVEKHVLPGMAVGGFGPVGILLLKGGLVPILFLVDREKDVFTRNYVLLLIGLLGLSMGFRNLLLMMVV